MDRTRTEQSRRFGLVGEASRSQREDPGFESQKCHLLVARRFVTTFGNDI